jgi:hypothetical protein
MCQSLQTKKGQEWIPDFLKDTSGTSIYTGGRDKPRPIAAADVPLGSGLADAAKREIMSRRERIARAMGEE